MVFVTLQLEVSGAGHVPFQLNDAKLTVARLWSLVAMAGRLPASPRRRLQYIDDEGDVIDVAVDSDVEELFRLATEASVVVRVSSSLAEALPPPVPLATPRSAVGVSLPASKAAGASPATDPSTWSSDLTFFVNGKSVTVSNPDPTMHLVEYLRDVALLKGTKIGCGEGGCGACTVVLSWQDATTKKTRYEPVNSCLRPLCSMAGYNVITAEGIVDSSGKAHPVQTALADNNGSQCGFCSPGWSMKAYSLLEKDASPSKLQVDNSFDGNLCRCTGIFPILNAYKTFSPSDGSSAAASSSRSGGCCGTCKGCSKVGAGAGAGAGAGTGAGAGAPDMEDLVSHRCGGAGSCDSHSTASSASSAATPASSLSSTTLPPAMPLPDALKDYTPVPLRFAHTFDGQDIEWYTPTTLDDLTALQTKYATAAANTVKYVAGNTAFGVEKYYNGTSPAAPTRYTVYIDVTKVPDLTTNSVADTGITVGAATSLADVIELCAAQDSMAPTYTNDPTTEAVLTATSSYSAVARHLLKVANRQVRSVGSWAGNLLLAAHHPDFPSDVVLTLLTMGVTLKVVQSGKAVTMPVEELYQYNSKNVPTSLVVSMTIPALTGITASTPGPNVIDTFKTMLRHQNSHALVNAGFNLTLSDSKVTSSTTITAARIFVGGVTKTLHRCGNTEGALVGKSFTQHTLTAAQAALVTDINAAGSAKYWGTTDAYRRSVATAYLYKLFVRVCPSSDVAAANSSAGKRYVRPVSTESSSYEVDSKEAPVSEPVIKLGALKQCMGEAAYTFDTELDRSGLSGALAVTDVATGTITAIDTTAAAAMEGVVRILTVADIPSTGSNDIGSTPGQEKLFLDVGDDITCQGQSVALVVADTFAHALAASLAVAITTSESSTAPIFTLKDAIAAKSFYSNDTGRSVKNGIISVGDAKTAIAGAKHQMSGTITMGGAKHFYMEVQNAVAKPLDGDGIQLTASTQSSGLNQVTAHAITGLPLNKIVCSNRRTGGGYGGKITRNIPVVAAASLAAYVMGTQVHVQLERGQDLRMTGGREDIQCDWSVGTDDDGVIVGCSTTFYSDGGAFMDGGKGTMDMMQLWGDNAYYFPAFYSEGIVCKTNLPAVTSMRAPGVVQSVYVMESIMNYIANTLGKDPNDVRTANFLRLGETTPYGQTIKYLSLPTVWQQLMDECSFDTVKASVDAFNKANRWRKQGLAMTPVKYGIVYTGYNAATLLRIYGDGSIEITTSGTEIGQGLYTKVAQAVAYELQAPMSSIVVSKSSTASTPTATITGGSGTSGACVESAVMACKTMNDRLAALRKANPKYTWQQLAAAAAASGMDMTAEAFFDKTSTPAAGFFDYYVYAAAFSQVEIDVLTGEVQLQKTHMVYDCGTSLNPDVDVGQIEGAFVIGLGYFLQEDLAFSDADGKLLSVGTWEYKPPFPLDIPEEFKLWLLKDQPNPAGILSSKATGEPPLSLANSLHFAVHYAVTAARADAGNTDLFELPVPATPCAIATACLTTTDMMTLS